MKHCSSCVHCNENLIAAYVKGVPKFNCTINHVTVEKPFWGGFHCENYKRDYGFFSEKSIVK